MNFFEQLKDSEQQSLLKFPVYISLLAANAEREFDDNEDEVMIDLNHIKTYTYLPVMTDFYYSAGEAFEQNLEQIDRDLPDGKLQRDVAIKIELRKLEKLLLKLDPPFSVTMNQTMKEFTKHVSKVHYNLLEDFIFPASISG